jgi:O-antigen/teichoic acid export membrane protein
LGSPLGLIDRHLSTLGAVVTRETASARIEGAQMSGVHAGAIVLVGVLALNLGNYVFHLIAARSLGPARYGDLATLIAISGLIALPLGGVQIWVARYVARYTAVGDDAAAHWFVRRALTYTAFGGAVATVALLALSWPLKEALGIASIAAVALTALTAFPAATAPITWGLAQGLQRFRLIAVTYTASAIVRVALIVLAFAAGLRVGGAMLATLASMLVALGVPLWVLRDWAKPAPTSGRRVTRREAARSLTPVLLGLLAITALTSVDVVVAKAALTEHEAGIYGSASLVGRVILYLPAAIITVLLPRVAARAADRVETIDLLRRSVLVTLAFCSLSTLVYAAQGSGIVHVAFGSEYADAAGLLWLFGIAMSGYAVLNVLLIYHLGLEDNAFAWLLVWGAAVQIAAFLLFHDSPREIVAVSIAVAAALLAAHEVLTRGLLIRAIVRR